ncbi:hypothetical protein [Plantactinospora sp. WMMB782]|uniref:hypothetical protein n=1 Tax=Plantactinospora sp. WMMB782 TaxID=3404121 RepID=UPI003B92C341
MARPRSGALGARGAATARINRQRDHGGHHGEREEIVVQPIGVADEIEAEQERE